MHPRLWKIVFKLFFFALLSSTVKASPSVGLSFSVPVITKDPEYLHGYRAALWYQPPSLNWEHTQIYFDAGFGHWWVTNTSAYRSLNIYSISPILRYYFTREPFFSPFFNISIGLAYLTKTHLEKRNLGMHFSFQDQLGFGVTFGQKKQFSLLLSALHYSNGSLCSMNAGITVPLMITAEYGFA
ncbi:MAG: hypothetical protein ACD_60C00029G0025 [uncultured bacterium]|nr:MAG: hypothetical protein ACD_60C00029G0025 [uncultured bacterium]